MKFVNQYQSIHDLAASAAGLSDFGSGAYQPRLRRLLEELDVEVRLSELGVTTLLEQIVGVLIGRLRTVQGLKDFPAALDQTIEKPLFIIGMGRTGTTVLHRYLAEDTSHQVLPMWLASLPKPRPPVEKWESDADFQQIKKSIDNSAFFNDDMRKIHPIYADQPDECRWLMDQTLWASTLPTTFGLKKCFDLLATEPAVDAYRYYRDGLNLIANGDQRRWVLKDPSHMLGIDSLLEVFPDACIVQTHRDPVDSFRSMASLGYEIRKMFEPNIDAQKIADWMLYAWAEQLRKF